MKKPNEAQITSKCVEVSKSLIDTTSGLHTQDLNVTRTNGDIARFVANIKGSEIINNEKIGAIASALKVDYRLLLNHLLPIIEKLGWLDIKWDGRRLKKIDEHIPPIQDTLSTLGKDWKNDASKIDEITVFGLNETSKKPYTEEALISELDTSITEFDYARSYGVEANYFSSFKSEKIDKNIIWSPLYWARNSDNVLRFIEDQTDTDFQEIGKLTHKLKNYPGTPSERIQDHLIINKGIESGYFPTVSIKMHNGVAYDYVFAATPQFSVGPETDIFEKARLIVSSLRAGQYHAEITKIKWPTLVLKAILDGSIRPHSSAGLQYAPLVTHGICKLIKIQKSYATLYKPDFIDTPLNRQAAKVAMEMLSGSESLPSSYKDPKIDDILKRGVFNYTSEIRRIRSAKKIEAKNEFNLLVQRMSESGVTE